MYSGRMNFKLLVIIGTIFFGCNSINQDGKKTSKEINQVNLEGQKVGLWQIYDDSVLISKGSYKDGLHDGLWTYWYNNGQKKEEGHYINGVRSGMWIQWYRDGELMWKGEWENGERIIEDQEYKAKISFIGDKPKDHVLSPDSQYHLRIRIQNIPASNLFVEVDKGEILWGGEPDLFVLNTSSDSMLTMAVGYLPDPDFGDFKNLISEINFRIR